MWWQAAGETAGAHGWDVALALVNVIQVVMLAYIAKCATDTTTRNEQRDGKRKAKKK